MLSCQLAVDVELILGTVDTPDLSPNLSSRTVIKPSKHETKYRTT